MTQRFRNFHLTFNNYTQEDFSALQQNLQNHGCYYYVIGEEVGESGTPHLQGTVCYKNARAMSAMIKTFDKKIHWEPVKDLTGSIKYCKKDNKFVAWGEEPKGQGFRTDLLELRDKIANGTTVDEICMDNPILYHQYGRTFNHIEDICLRKKFRTTMTRGIWYWGRTGTGKSHIAFDGYDPETAYNVPNDNGWWDGYKQQKTVIFNDFRGEIPYNQMLQLVDKWPCTVRRRGREPMPFTSEFVIVTSSLPPWDIYTKRAQEDEIGQLLRRFEVVKLSQQHCDTEPLAHTEVAGGNTRTPATNACGADLDIDFIKIMNEASLEDKPTFDGIVRTKK